ncbi:MAG: ABC transporter ATP-binding protein [Candidatus Omnitrophica bacterium 4484_213]|nr:MAG: ABC transporter ATP-binding protein [Candidatus Omnitrophica bacterium 4484_213]
MSKAKLRTVNLSKRYKSGKAEVWALREVNLEIKKGEFLVIIGPSGAGKSTLLHLLGALDSPSSGKVFLDKLNISQISASQRAEIRRKKVGFVFQFYHLLPEFTALENVMLPTRVAGCRLRLARGKAKKLLEKLGLENRANHRPSELSGGEQQRVAIARALINEPEILLCDEPTGNLDSQTGERIVSILEGLNKEGRTLVIVSHEQKIAQRAGRLLKMEDGGIL